MKHRLLVGAVALLLFSLSLLLSLPAERALGYFDDLLAANELHLQGISGTLHSGGAGQLGWRGRDLGALRWQLAPGCLLLGRICLNLQLQNSAGYLQGEIELFSDGAVMFSGLEGQLPAGAAVSLLLTLPVEIEGLLSLHLEQLVLDASSTPVAAQGVVSWHQAALGAPQRLDFGDLQLRLNTTAEGIVGELRAQKYLPCFLLIYQFVTL